MKSPRLQSCSIFPLKHGRFYLPRPIWLAARLVEIEAHVFLPVSLTRFDLDKVLKIQFLGNLIEPGDQKLLISATALDPASCMP